MLRRLISAVFVLSLVLALNGTAVSDVTRGELNPVIKIDATNPRFADVRDARPEQPTFKKPQDALKELPSGLSAPPAPQIYWCDVLDYTNGGPAYFWTIPDAYGDDLFNMRFTSEEMANGQCDCTTKVAHYLMYGTEMVGAPDMRCYLWADNGFGFPGAKLDSVDIPNALLPTSGIAYVSADFTFDWYGNPVTYVFSNGEEYHYGWTTLDNSGAGTDVLAIISDDATPPSSLEERASENWGGMWGTMLNDWQLDVSFFILDERCCECHYTDCYWQGYATNLAYLWQAPHPIYGDEAYAMRYDVGGRETLMVVDVGIYDDGSGLCGNDDVIMTVYDDDGAGLPGAQIAQVVIPAGGYVFYPAYTTFDFNYVLTPQNNLTSNDFHIAFSSSAIPGSGDYECCLSSDGTDGVGRSSSYFDTTGAGDFGWVDMLSGWGLDCNFIFYAYMCKDEYYECAWDWCNNGFAYFWRLPDAWDDIAQAQKFAAPGDECQVMDVVWYLYDNGTPTAYTLNSEVQVYTDAGGLPGTKLAGITIGPGTAYPYVLFPGGMVVDFEPLGVYVTGDYWVAIECPGTDSTLGIRTLSDDVDVGGGGCYDSWAEFWGIWALMPDDWGFPARDAAAYVEEKQCCIPFGGLACYPSEDWPTYQRDYARTGHSMNAVGDAWCDLTLNWSFEHPSNGCAYCGPIIAYDLVIQSFDSEYKVFNLYSGAPLYTLSGYPDVGSYVRCTPTVDMISGHNDPVLFTSGGIYESITAWDLYTGTKLWGRDPANTGCQRFGMTRWGHFIVLDIAGDDILYWSTDDGYIVAAMAATGQLFGGGPSNPLDGWGDTTQAGNNPIVLGAQVYVSGATDGENLFYNTYTGGIGEGDIVSIPAATGLPFNWQLSSLSGCQGSVVYTHPNGYMGDESFSAGIMYDNGSIYTCSRMWSGDHPTDGLFYRIGAANGNLIYAVPGARGMYQTPIMDRNHVYMPSLSRWVTPPIGGSLFKVHKNSGAVQAAYSAPAGAYHGVSDYYVDAVVSCEPEDGDYPDDLIYGFTRGGFLTCINSVTFEEVYRRRIDHLVGWGPNYGMAGAIAHDGEGFTHVIFADFWGTLYDMTKQEDRPRLQFETYKPTIAVDFGLDPLYKGARWDSIFYNSGCAVLNFTSVVPDDVDPGTSIPQFASAVEVDFMARAATIADNLARDAFLSKYLRPSEDILDENSMVSVREMDFSKERINRAAAGWPPYLISVDTPFVGYLIAPGAYGPLALTVNQPIISRGPQCFYITLGTNDPDFFLNNPAKLPTMKVCLVGGCLIDTTTLHFGMGCVNEQLVTNTGRLGNGDWGDGPAGHSGFLIDGDGTSYYQGAYVYAVDTFQIAVHTQDWTAGGGEEDAFVSMQPDPNWCDDDCKPFLWVGEPCGEITYDGGITYVDVLVDKVCKSFLDSVQDFGWTGAWDWEDFSAPFSNALTMGLYCNGVVYGTNDHPDLANLTIELLQFYERNGNSVEGWYLGEMYDCDNGGDNIGIDRSISTAWTYNQPAMDQAWGQIKIPFGCVCVCNSHANREPIINIWGTSGVSASQGFWNWIAFWDACYSWMDAGPGSFIDPLGPMDGGDEEAFVTLAKHDFTPHDTFEVAIAHFGLFNLTDASDGGEYAALADIANKWTGWGRGDVNNDRAINLADIVYLCATVNGGPGAVPFRHLSDVNADGAIDMLDVNYLIDFYFWCGPCPIGQWICDP